MRLTHPLAEPASEHLNASPLLPSGEPHDNPVSAQRADEGPPPSPYPTSRSADLPTCPPVLDPDALLADYLAAEMPLVGVARRHNLTLDQLLDHLDHPDTRAALARLKRANQTRAEHIAADARPAAISALANIAAAADPTESRRAATALLRAISSPLLPPSNRPVEKVSVQPTDEGRNASSPDLPRPRPKAPKEIHSLDETFRLTMSGSNLFSPPDWTTGSTPDPSLGRPPAEFAG